MLSLKALPFLQRHPIPIPIPIIPKSRSSISPKLSLSMAHTATATTVEHVVLFKVRDTADPTAMISNLRSLSSLNLTTHLSAGPILRSPSPSSPFAFTHLLHSRYLSKPDLATYASHPDHVSVVQSHVLPVCDDVLAVDWLAPSPLPPPLPGSAVRLTLAKPNPGTSAAQLLDAIRDATAGAADGVSQLSYGENFSPARSKGYEVAMIAVFPGVEEMDKALEGAEAAKEKVRPLIESVIVLDYVMPVPAAGEAMASL